MPRYSSIFVSGVLCLQSHIVVEISAVGREDAFMTLLKESKIIADILYQGVTRLSNFIKSTIVSK